MIDWVARLDPQLVVVCIALLGALLAFPLLFASLRRFRRLKVVRGALYLLVGGIVLLVVTGAALVAANLFTYARLTHEQEAARVTTRRLAERHYAVTLHAAGRPAPSHYELRGDEWQLDARVLKWRGMGNLLGLDTVYRLERLSGRYADLPSELGAPRSVHALAQDPGVDFWSLARRYHAYLPLADALYGSAAYVPLAEGAEYSVTVSASGLVVRPANDAARKALGGWK